MKKFMPFGLAIALSLTMCGSSVFALEQNGVKQETITTTSVKQKY